MFGEVINIRPGCNEFSGYNALHCEFNKTNNYRGFKNFLGKTFSRECKLWKFYRGKYLSNIFRMWKQLLRIIIGA